VAGLVTIEILDAAGGSVNRYSSDAPASGGFTPRVTKTGGMNRFVWDVRNQAGLVMPPAGYQVRLTAGAATQTQAFNVLIDPNVAADGVTAADLKEQYEHNTRMRQLVGDAAQAVARLRELQAALQNNGTAAKTNAVEAIAAKLLSEPVRYGKPGLQAHITYLAGMTTGADQKIGRDAIERYTVLRKELDTIRAQLESLR
jgi:hypothetical protein